MKFLKIFIFTLIILFVFISPVNAQSEIKKTDHLTSTLPQKDFSTNETPQIKINKTNPKNLFTFISQIFGKKTSNLKDTIKIIVTDPDNKVVNSSYIQTTVNSDNQIQVAINSEKLIPGKYKVKIIDSQTNETINQDFTWGVLVINPDQSVYSVNSTAFLAMAVLDESGNMVCDADLTLTVTSPDNSVSELSLSAGTITRNPECRTTAITLTPDFQAYLPLSQIGTYQLKLTAITKNGSYSITDSLSVESNPDFIIKRLATTRIYPPNNYPVTIEITSSKDFVGTIIEKVPLNFKITNTNAKITQDSSSQILSWETSFKAFQTTSFSYSYLAPQISPNLYSLGPINLINSQNKNYTESRSWQIAADALIALDSSSTSGANQVGQTAVWTHTVASGGVLFVVVNARNSTDANRPVSSITYDGAALTKAVSIQNNTYDLGSEIWYITNPTTGSARNIIVTLSGASGNYWAAAASSFTGVDTTNPIGVGSSASANASSISTSITPSGTDSWIIDSIYSKSNGAITATQTEQSNQTVNSSGDQVGHSTAGPVSVGTTMSWTWTPSGTNNATIVAVEILKASNNSPALPTLILPADIGTSVSQTPTFQTVSTDTEDDDLQYELKICTDSDMTTNCQTFDQTSSNVGWSGQDVGTSAYSSGTTATYVLQVGNSLAQKTTYYWKTRAIDPTGSGSWSSTQTTPFSFQTGGNLFFRLKGIKSSGIKFK